MSGYTTSAALSRPLVGSRSQERPRRGLAAPLSLAGVCLVALALVWVVAEFVPAAHVRDGVIFRHFLELNRYGTVHTVAGVLPHLLNPVLFTLFGISFVLIAIARERPRVALAVGLIMALGPLTAELLKPLMAHSHVSVGFLRIGAASYPSGHSTAAGVLAMSAVLVAAPRWRPLVAALAAAFMLAVGAALLIRAWHMPSDVLGGWLLSLMWVSLAVAAVRATELRWPSRRKSPSPRV
jgi:membrane-associated phospholipid phosphatase